MAVHLVGGGFSRAYYATKAANPFTTPTWSDDIWLACWVRTNTSGAQCLVALTDGTTAANGIRIMVQQIGPGYSEVNYNNGSHIQRGSTDLSDGAWHHLCGIIHRDGDFRSVVLYEDGVYIGETGAIAEGPVFSEDLYDSKWVGSYPNGFSRLYQANDTDIAEAVVFHGVSEANTNIPAQLWAMGPTLQVLAGATVEGYCPLMEQAEQQWSSGGGGWSLNEITAGAGAVTTVPHPPVPSSLAAWGQQGPQFLPRAGVGGILVGA